jgi:hypothetical protein
MEIGWKKLLPLAIANLFVYALETAALQLHYPGWAHVAIIAGTVLVYFVFVLRPSRRTAL